MTSRNSVVQARAATQDLDIAIKRLHDEKLSLVIVKQGQTVFTNKEPGIRGLVEAIGGCGISLHGAAVADRVLGKAAALLCVYARFSSVYASVMSKLGEKTLGKFSIPYQHGTLVPKILNRHGTDMCPFEKAVVNTESPEEALKIISRRVRESALREA